MANSPHPSQTHGETVGRKWSPEYRAYWGAKSRCTYPSEIRYKNYGGRGIEFRFESFNHFLQTVGRRPSQEYSLDRINVDGHYEPGNVRWATRQIQAENTHTTRFLTLNDKTQALTAWARDINVSRYSLHSRLRSGWCDTCILTLPINSNRSRCPHKSL